MGKERNRKDERNYKNSKRKLASQARGITLVALVITIIIIIILATVTINMAFGDDGIIKRAEQAKDMYANDTAYTDQSMANATAYLDEMLNGVAGGGSTGEGGGTEEPEESENVEIFSDIYSETKLYTDSEGKTAWIPKGFAVGTSDNINKINEGLVITTAIDENHYSTGNEFVWIPVDDESLAEMYITSESPIALSGSASEATATTSIYSNLRIRSGDSDIAGKPGTLSAREPDLVTSYDIYSSYYSVLAGSAQEMAEDMVEEYTATYNSIAKYDGFYIGRYELTGTVESPTVQKEEKVLVNQNWYNLKKACTNLVQAGENYGAQSEMIYGNQWDEVMDWLVDTGAKTAEQINVDSSSWGNYSDYNTANGYEEGNEKYEAEAGTGVLPAGSSEYWKANNIYDLAGNASDWTQEAEYTMYRATRGGCCYDISGSYSPASYRLSANGSIPENNNSYNSSRPALYIK